MVQIMYQAKRASSIDDGPDFALAIAAACQQAHKDYITVFSTQRTMYITDMRTQAYVLTVMLSSIGLQGELQQFYNGVQFRDVMKSLTLKSIQILSLYHYNKRTFIKAEIVQACESMLPGRGRRAEYSLFRGRRGTPSPDSLPALMAALSLAIHGAYAEVEWHSFPVDWTKKNPSDLLPDVCSLPSGKTPLTRLKHLVISIDFMVGRESYRDGFSSVEKHRLNSDLGSNSCARQGR